MSSDSSSEAANTLELTNAVYEVSSLNQTFDLKGWLQRNDTEQANIELILQKRGSDFYYSIPFEWFDTIHWRASLDMDRLDMTKGTWDFYVRYEGKKFRVKVEEHVTNDAQLLQKQGAGSQRLWVYRTKKGSLSIKSSSAAIHMDSLTFSRDALNSWEVQLQGVARDALLENVENGDAMTFVVKNRNTTQENVFPLKIDRQKQQATICTGVNYRELFHSDDVLKQTWDCYIALNRDGDSHLLRMTWTGETSLKENSRIQVEESPLYQYYVDITGNYNVMIKRAELAVQNNVESVAFAKQQLTIKGSASLDTVDPNTYNRMSRYVVVKQKETQERLRLALPNDPNSEDYPNSFAASIPLNQLFQLGNNGKEVYDLFVQYQDHNHNVYEKKLGSEQYTYFKDGFITETTLKYKGYTRFYIVYTPNGNLKLETYPMSTSAYLYLKYGSKLERKRSNDKEIWLIGERNNTAQDTGYHFFKYCREHYPNLRVYYVINRDANDVRHLKGLGNVLYSGSLKHARISSIATTFIGSHELDYILPVKGNDLDNYVNGKRVFLQHGVLGRKNVEYHKYYYQHPFHLFCVSSQAEKEMVQHKLQYHPDEVKITGLSRFDYLLQPHDVKNNILLIPTWRDWLNTEKALKNSAYFQRYQSLFHNHELHQLLEANDLTLIFYPHYRMQPFVAEFKKFATDRMQIVEQGERTVQDLLMESPLMITDYSSVSFDFNYMSKPVIFYHFDAARFFKDGMLRPVEETFLGDICSTEDEVVRAIRHYVQNGFQEKATVQANKQQVFAQIDQQNNERIFQEIKRLT